MPYSLDQGEDQSALREEKIVCEIEFSRARGFKIITRKFIKPNCAIQRFFNFYQNNFENKNSVSLVSKQNALLIDTSLKTILKYEYEKYSPSAFSWFHSKNLISFHGLKSKNLIFCQEILKFKISLELLFIFPFF